MTKHKKIKRENFFLGSKAIINPKLQFRFILFNLINISFIFGSIALFLILKLDKTSSLAIEKDILKIQFILPIFLIFLLGSIISMVLNTYMSYKVSEPIERLKVYFKNVADQQKVLPLSFRKGDYFRDIPSIIVNSLMRLNKEESSLEKDVDKKAS